MKKVIEIAYQMFEDDSHLNEVDADLLKKARAITSQAYAPYSKFHVGAAAVLQNGNVYTGTNQENSSYPVGICAERSLMSTIANANKDHIISKMAISYHNHNIDQNSTPATPCGMCRQAMAEYTKRQNQPFQLILSGQSGEVWVFENATDLLPLQFSNILVA